MNWFKQAQAAHIQTLGWDSNHSDESGDMAILFAGTRRVVYKDISKDEYFHMRSLLSHKNYPKAAELLKSYKDRYDRSQLTSRGNAPEDEQGMMDELEERGFLGQNQ